MARLGGAQYLVESVDSARGAIDACAVFRPKLVITDLRMEPMDGLGLLDELKRRWPDITVIILTAHGTIPEAVKATQSGAFAFLVKPITKSELLSQVRRALAGSAFKSSNGEWRANIVSRSRLMEDRLAQANHAARSDVPVLLSGESGTGKELFARAIHAAGRRREQPFTVMTGLQADEQSLEDQLFGNKTHGSAGSAEAGGGGKAGGGKTGGGKAGSGTLFLEEIADLPLPMQVRLAAALRREQEPDGGSGTAARAGARFICSTSRDLKLLVAAGQFNEDLYYLVSLLSIEVPPLGRRREDIPLLVSRFLEQATEGGGVGKMYTPKAVHLLVAAHWPGNVRQLFDLVKQNVSLSPKKVMTEEFVKESLGSAPTNLQSFDDARNEFCRDYLVKNLQTTSGNVTQSARLAKRSRTDFYKLLSRFRVEPDEYKKRR